MPGRTDTDLPLPALLMAVRRRKPKAMVYVLSAQGSQFTRFVWQEILEQRDLFPGISRRGRCLDNPVVESFFILLKRERIRRNARKTRDEARRDALDCIEVSDHPQRKHVRKGMLSPIDFELQQTRKLQGGQLTRAIHSGDSRPAAFAQSMPPGGVHPIAIAIPRSRAVLT